MRYCVIKGTTRPINKSDVHTDNEFYAEALSAGITAEQVEILTQEEHDAREALEPQPTPQPSNNERIEQLERENALLKAQKQALSEQVDFHEELIVELATQIYA